MFTHRQLSWIRVNRKKRTLLKNLTMFTVFFLILMVYSGKGVHVERNGSHVHVGVGTVHTDGREVHFSTSEGWTERLRGPLEAEDPRVVSALRDHHLQLPSNNPYTLDTYTNRLNYKDMDSWKFLHERLVRLMAHRPPGFFIEAGALDGQYLSNTLHLEKVYGWRGLLVEANPSAYKQLLKKNRRAWSSNTCLAITPYPKEMVLEMLDTHEETETSQALWVIRGSSFLTEAGGADQQYQANRYETTFAVVQCFPLITYLRALNVTKVDLLSLDVEGAERMILDTVPWDSLDISVLLVEHHGDVKGKDLKFIKSIEDRGYELFDYQIDKDNIGDYIFVKRGFV
ncbi:uncharacterized protein LOC121870557 [Homarus americanus]|uniref:Star-like 2 n=1 Tax=Homarus americanus TaxID=6706 RepID=A0A8J5JWA6_HOMAM|nr:uncharacterized protein LOC121870557 [Homarus americanus]KAG7165405.1 Star-like 2 [Homarus americanus]